MRDLPEIVLVVAVADNGVIGRDNGLPWHIPGDLQRFKRITLGKPVLMGRKTFESIGRPLPGRHNIVLTRDAGWRAEGVTVAAALDAALAAAGPAGPIMVIGGAEIYARALPLASRIELTRVHLRPEGNAHFSPLDANMWAAGSPERVAASGAVPAHDFITYRRR